MAVHNSFNSFNLALSRYGSHEVPEFQRGRLTVIALEGAKVLTELTPVDTGRAKGNWQFTVGRPAQGDVARLDPSPEGVAGSHTTSDVLQNIKNWKPGQWVWFHNGLDYIAILNDGTGGRTAHHMLERTKDHLERWVGQP